MGFIEKFLWGIRRQEKWYQKFLYNLAINMRSVRLPFPKILGGIFFYIRKISITVWNRLKQFLFNEPMFRYRCASVGKGLYLEDDLPFIEGYGSLIVGNKVRFSGHATFVMGYKVYPNPTITIGNNVTIGYRSVYSCAQEITIGNNVAIAPEVHIFDNNNHPLDPDARARNETVEKENIAPVIIEDNVWIGSNAFIMKGVTIGKGSVIAAASVVTKDVPPMSIMAGNPAKLVKSLSHSR